MRIDLCYYIYLPVLAMNNVSIGWLLECEYINHKYNCMHRNSDMYDIEIGYYEIQQPFSISHDKYISICLLSYLTYVLGKSRLVTTMPVFTTYINEFSS